MALPIGGARGAGDDQQQQNDLDQAAIGAHRRRIVGLLAGVVAFIEMMRQWPPRLGRRFVGRCRLARLL